MASIISAGTTSGTALNFSGDTSGVLQLASNGTTTALSISTAQVVTLTNALPVTSGGTGVTTSTGTGAVVLATSPTIATPTMTGQATIPTINLTGGQIAFPATQSASSNANTLDDYEEGTWTASYNNGTIVAQSCQYTKVGRLVTATFSIQFAATTTALGRVSGLPFAVSGVNYVATHGREWFNTGNTTQCVTSIASTFFDLFFYNNTTGVVISSNYGISGTLVYNN